ncbi:M16 family metallopeptidase [Parvularcula lutaonensis]|uniref:M16 family metallopeptidase n=1 Tax=Parvularcula lutaonensis TaxID=491923 RepID=A0ABV7MFB8_9PROT|nr:pitrilysin family protein [Parvularcula lutaonensis]
MKRLLTLAGSAVALAANAFAQDIDIPFEKFETDNGLTVIVHEDRKAPVVAVSVWYKVGSKDEPEGKTGFAHLFEHLMFNGTENYDDEWFKPLQEVGATGLNGTTNLDRTNYFQTVPTPALDRILWMESDRMGHFLGAVTQEKLDEQRGVVQNEKRQGENQPYGRVFTNILEGLFPEGHPYSHSVIGSMEDLDAASLEDVKAWFEEYYGPNNAILVLAGDIDAEQAKPLVEKYFGDIEPGPPLTKWESWVPDRETVSRETMYDQVPQARIYRVWAAPGDADPQSTDLAIAASILGDGKNSRLYKELVYDRQIATDVSVFNFENIMSSIFGVVVSVKDGESVEEVEKALDAEIEKFLARPPRKDEVDLVSTKTRASIIRGLEEVGGFGGKAVTLAQGELVAGDPGFFQTELEELEAATVRGVQSAAQKWLKDNYYQLTVLPFEKGEVAATGVDRSTGLPDVTGETELDFPDVQTAELSNGVKVVLAQRDTIPVVNIAVQFDAGYAADQGGKLGLANFTARMLDEGAGKYDALELAAELEKLGATLGAGSNLDATTVQMSALKENLRPSLDILGDVILRPKFDEEEIERQRTQILTGIAQEKSNPTSIAIRMLPSLMYGPDHAYGMPLTGSGTEDDVQSISRDDLVSFKNRWMRPDNATIYVVGDTTMDEIRPLLERTFGDWKASGPKPEKNIAEVGYAEPQVVLVDRPGSPQSFILAGHIAPPTGVENNIEITAMNEVLGGSFNARINSNLREEKGWSYGAYSTLVGAEGQRPFIIIAPVQTDKTAESIAEILSELNGFMGENPPTEEELNRVILDNVRSLPGQYETSRAVLGSLLSSGRYGRDYNYPETLPAKYRSLDTAAIERAAGEVLRPEKLVWMIIGDAEKIRDDIEAAGIGPVTVMSLDEL